MTEPEISVCIATWKRSKKLSEIIVLLENQTIPKSRYEIIVADSNSPDDTAEKVAALQEKYGNIKYIADAENVLAVKRNVGVAAASSPIIVFMDDDVYPCKKFIEAHLKANTERENTFFCGQVRFDRELVRKSNYYLFRDMQHLKKKDIGRDLPFNNIVVMNLSFRKEYFETVGGVNEKYIGYGLEDIDFGWRVKEAGFDIRYLPEAFAVHREESASIAEYGGKLYKSGLNGNRIFRELCPGGYNALSGRKSRLFGKIVSHKIISKPLEKFLTLTDGNRWLYSYLLYKVYIISRSYQGRRDQKKYAALDLETVKKGW